MSESAEQQRVAGWMHAEGDSPGTVRFWTGTEWQGSPRPVGPPTQPPPPTSNKHNRWRLVFGIVISVVVLSTVANFVSGVLQRRAVDAAARDFLTTAQSGDLEEELSFFDRSCWPDSELDTVLTYFSTRTIEDFDLTQRTMQKQENVETATVSGTIVFADGATSLEAPVTLELTERSQWQLCRVTVAEGASDE